MGENTNTVDSTKRVTISLADTYRNLVSGITSDHIFYIQICFTVFLGLIILYYLTRRVARSVSGRSIVLVGGCEAGKTALFYTLTQGCTPPTVTSFKENHGMYDTGKKRIRLVDVPGHERVRDSAFARHKTDARAIVFLLDSVTLHTNVRDVAEQLYSVLTDAAVQRSGCPVAVVCNKQDNELAITATVIERALQKEIDVLRETSSSRLASISSSSSATTALGRPGQAFKFSHLTANSVTFIEAAVLGSGKLANLQAWISRVV